MVIEVEQDNRISAAFDLEFGQSSKLIVIIVIAVISAKTLI